eukprot:8707584-Ditylum_brightwellii.AAC.2
MELQISKVIQTQNFTKIADVTKRMTDIESDISNMKTAGTNFGHSYKFDNNKITLKSPDDLIIARKINLEISTLNNIVNNQENPSMM